MPVQSTHYRYTVSENEGYGHKDDTGTWHGMVAEVLYNACRPF